MHNSSSIQVRSQPQPSATGTALLCVTLLLAYILLGDSSATASDTAHQTALLLGIGLLLSLLCDAQQGLRNLVRTDTVCLLSLYGLIMVERLTKDELFNSMNTVQTVNSGLSLVLLAFGGLAIGRHLFHQPSAPRPLDSSADVSIRWLFAVIVIAFAVSVLHILLSTSFSVSQIYEGLIGPRFARPWMRGRLGGWHTLLNELSLLFYLIPPLAAIIASRWRECSLVQIVTVSGICFFTFFEAFAGGTIVRFRHAPEPDTRDLLADVRARHQSGLVAEHPRREQRAPQPQARTRHRRAHEVRHRFPRGDRAVEVEEGEDHWRSNLKGSRPVPAVPAPSLTCRAQSRIALSNLVRPLLSIRRTAVTTPSSS